MILGCSAKLGDSFGTKLIHLAPWVPILENVNYLTKNVNYLTRKLLDALYWYDMAARSSK